MTSFQIVCSGPGPHNPPNGVLGTSTTEIADARCGASACRPAADPQVATVADIVAKAQTALTNNAAFIGTVANRRTAIANGKSTAQTGTTATVTTTAQAQTQIRALWTSVVQSATALDDLNNQAEANARQSNQVIKLLLGLVVGTPGALNDTTGT